MEQKTMKEINVFRLGNYGVKGFEILFKKNIDKALADNGFDHEWRNIMNEPIFETILSIYNKGDSAESSIIYSLQEYYNKLKSLTDAWIKENLTKINDSKKY